MLGSGVHCFREREAGRGGAGEGIMMGATPRVRWGKLGGSEKGVKLTIFPFEEAELYGELTVGKGGREKRARLLQGLLVGQVVKGRVGRGSQTCRLTEQGDVLTWRGDWIFLKASFCKGWMQVDNRSELLMGQPEAESP